MFHANATQIAGMLVFGIAAILAFINWRKAVPDRRIWLWISVIHLVLAIDILMEGRYVLGKALRFLLGTNFYHDRRGWQFGLVLILGLVIWVLSKRMFLDRSNRVFATKLSLLSTMLTVLVFVFEVISLHQIDAVLYHRIGPILLIGWIWIFLASVTSLGAIIKLWHISGQKQ